MSDEVYVRLADDGETWRCYRTLDGKTRDDVGCDHASTVDALEHANDLRGKR